MITFRELPFDEWSKAIELAKKHNVDTSRISEEIIRCFGWWQFQKNVTADMLEYIDEELAIQQGDSAKAHAGIRSVRD